ncbi:MAG TPA: hypothetical protein VL242_40875 [Sorangium sp.]|nr:hypothetical protein [Sorangium sp.]
MSTGSAPPILLPVAERARNNALFAVSTLVASACAVSAADSPTTSRSSSVARCSGDKHCRAATKAKATLSLSA